MQNNIKVGNFLGGHDINVIGGAKFDPSIRKFRGGEVIVTIPYSGQMLSARSTQMPASPITICGVEVPTLTKQIWEDVDELPEGFDYYIVSAMYVSACRELGRDTSRLLTIGGTVVDEKDRVCGTIGFNRN